MEDLEKAYGKALGYEFVAKRELGKSIAILGFYIKRESSPVQWRFDFYNPEGKGWRLINIDFVDSLDDVPIPN